MTRAAFAACCALFGGCLLLTGWLNGWHHSDDIPSGRGGVMSDGAINSAELATVYEGRLLSPRDLYLLQRKGLAQAGVVTGPLACQGVTLQFDTQAEADAYMAKNPDLAKGQVPCAGVALHPALRAD
jgi:hypothetical protein